MTFNHFNELTQHLQTNIYEFDNTHRESFNKVIKELNLSEIDSYIYKLTKGSNIPSLMSIYNQDFDWESLKPSVIEVIRNDYTYNLKCKYNNTSLSNYNSTPVTTWVKLVSVNYKPKYSSKKNTKKI